MAKKKAVTAKVTAAPSRKKKKPSTLSRPDLFTIQFRTFDPHINGFYNQRAKVLFTFADTTFNANPNRPEGPEYTDLLVKVGTTYVTATLDNFVTPPSIPPKRYIVEAFLYINSTPSPVPAGTTIDVTVSVRKRSKQAQQQP